MLLRLIYINNSDQFLYIQDLGCEWNKLSNYTHHEQMQTNNNIKMKVFISDRLKAGSVEHQAVIKFSRIYCEYFHPIIAIRINDKNSEIIQALSVEDVYLFQATKIANIYEKIVIIFHLLQGLWILNQNQYFTGLKPFNTFLYHDQNTNRVKIKPYLASPIQGLKFGEPKKDKETARNGIELCFDCKKTPASLDIWKWAVFAASFLFQFQLDKYIDVVLASEKPTQFNPSISKKNDFVGSSELLKCLTSCIHPDPQKRPKFADISLIFQKILVISTPINQSALQTCKQAYLKKQQSARSQMQIEITENILLTQELKKKLNASFVKNGLKAPKSYKPIYRATRFDFNTRVFYEMCSQKAKLVFIIDTEQSGIICCYIEPTITICESNGLAGNYIADQQRHSFIYSIKNQQSYKLNNKDRAYRSVPGKGPIIGDGDIILSSNRNKNECNFPQSYQTGKFKILMKQPQFRVRNYDVYMANY